MTGKVIEMAAALNKIVVNPKRSPFKSFCEGEWAHQVTFHCGRIYR